ncbi:tyrosine-type recombinase/integrase [Roseovarius ramblicola]|uniref:Tyrosine-type recombinase/integrase n=2 Tax=Roseovarius ramblicola TaxID=2022336 RepID=A0ABV5I425_9RHOB
MSVHVRILPIDDWPPCDQDLWHRAIRNGGLFDEVGPLAHMTEQTLGMIMRGYGKWLSWLSKVHPELLSVHPADRLDLETFVSFIESNAHLSPHTQHFYADTTLRLLSRCFPDREWGQVKRAVLLLQGRAKAYVSHRKDGRILSGAHVLGEAMELETSAHQSTGSDQQRALRQRNGTIIAFLALIPIRRRALTSLRLGESVVIDGDDLLIVMRPDLTKTKSHWETLVPTSIAPLLVRYIQLTRPALMIQGGHDHNYLWVTNRGAPISDTSMGTLIRNQTRKLFGVPISPHLFRDIAATTMARASPEAVGNIRSLLDHRGHETAEKYYNHATALEIGRNHAQLIDSIRQGD